jgi:serine/threonine protein kinase
MSHEQMITKIEREIAIMHSCSHPNIVGLHEVLEDCDTDSLILIVTYADHGSLLPQRFVSDPIPEERCRWIFAQIAEAVRAIHVVNIVHRDIKPENILTCDRDHVLLADFSAAKCLADDSDLISDIDGTPAFYSPEECRGELYHAKPADIWSMGVSLYLMVFGHLPFFDAIEPEGYLTQLFKILKAIQESELKLDPNLNISEDLSDLLFRLMDKNAQTRLTAEQVLAHPWVVKAGYDPQNIKLPEYLSG